MMNPDDFKYIVILILLVVLFVYLSWQLFTSLENLFIISAKFLFKNFCRFMLFPVGRYIIFVLISIFNAMFSSYIIKIERVDPPVSRWCRLKSWIKKKFWDSTFSRWIRRTVVTTIKSLYKFFAMVFRKLFRLIVLVVIILVINEYIPVFFTDQTFVLAILAVIAYSLIKK